LLSILQSIPLNLQLLLTVMLFDFKQLFSFKNHHKWSHLSVYRASSKTWQLLGCRLLGCQNLMEDIGSRVSKHENLLTCPQDNKSRGKNRQRSSRDDQRASMSYHVLDSVM